MPDRQVYFKKYSNHLSFLLIRSGRTGFVNFSSSVELNNFMILMIILNV